MAEASAFRSVIDLMNKIGLYDIILPFLLVFTIVFAVLEKTKILGIEKVDGKEITKKNLNAMVALIMAFLVVASTKLVSLVNEVMANVVLLLLLIICFLMLVGSLMGDKQFSLDQYKGWTKFFMVLIFIGIVVIFLNAMDWLKYAAAIFLYWNEDWAAAILFILIILGFMLYVTWSPKSKDSKSDSK